MKMRKKQTGRRIMAVLLSFLLLIGVMPVTVTPVRAEDATQSEVNADAGTDVDADADADACDALGGYRIGDRGGSFGYYI